MSRPRKPPNYDPDQVMKDFMAAVANAFGAYDDRNYEGDGFCLLYKQYKSGQLQWPRTGEEARQISGQQLRWLLEGLNPE